MLYLQLGTAVLSLGAARGSPKNALQLQGREAPILSASSRTHPSLSSPQPSLAQGKEDAGRSRGGLRGRAARKAAEIPRPYSPASRRRRTSGARVFPIWCGGRDLPRCLQLGVCVRACVHTGLPAPYLSLLWLPTLAALLQDVL